MTPFELVVTYLATFKAVNKKDGPGICYSGGWFTFKSPGLSPTKYRRKQVEEMLGRLRKREAESRS